MYVISITYHRLFGFSKSDFVRFEIWSFVFHSESLSVLFSIMTSQTSFIYATVINSYYCVMTSQYVVGSDGAM